jgi:hypothetical protein
MDGMRRLDRFELIVWVVFTQIAYWLGVLLGRKCQ